VGSAAGGNGAAAGGGGGTAAGGFEAQRRDLAKPYSTRAIYFRRELFRSTADCLTAAYTQHLPLEVCR
jgi:hypothetical protein